MITTHNCISVCESVTCAHDGWCLRCVRKCPQHDSRLATFRLMGRILRRSPNRTLCAAAGWSRNARAHRIQGTLNDLYAVERSTLARDNQNENAATIKMRMPRRLAAL